MDTRNHAKQRLEQRILSQNTIDVRFETSTGNYTKVGVMKITDLFKSNVQSKTERINNTNFKGKDVAVLISQMGINNNVVQFDSKESEMASKGQKLVASVVDSRGESNGDVLYAIIRNNKHITTCMVKSYSGFKSLADKLRVQFVVKNLKNFK